MFRRFYLTPDEWDPREPTLVGSEASHALRVLRTRAGDRILVLNGVGDEFLCEVTGTGRREVSLRVLDRRRIEPAAHRVTLIQAVPKGRVMETIIQKATELGVTRIVPVVSARAVPEWTRAEAAAKRDRWHLIAVEAIKQCGSAWLPEVGEPRDLALALEELSGMELSFLASLQPASRHPREWLETFVADHARLPRTVSVWIGPEGDFTVEEVKRIEGAGALPITLGPLTLRSETAALYCLATLQYELRAPHRTIS